MSGTESNNLYQSYMKLYRQMFRAAQLNMHGNHEIYRGQAVLLQLIEKNNGASQRELAEQLDIRPSSMTEMITKTESIGLIERRQDEKDRRVMRIYLTEKGKTVAASISGTVDERLGSIFNTLSEEEKSQLLNIIQKLSANMEKMDLTKEDSSHKKGDLYLESQGTANRKVKEIHQESEKSNMPSYLL